MQPTNDFLSLAAQSHPHRLAIWDGDARLSYAQLNQRVAALCDRLDALGVRRGERVAVLLDRGLEAVTLVHALARLGAVLVPLNTRLTPEEMRWQIEAAGCARVLCALSDFPLEEAIPLADLPPAAEPDCWLRGALDLEADFGILFTSGTTGRPKGAVLTWGNLFWSATASAFRLGVLPSDRWLLTLPLYHVGGLAILLRSALYGTAVALPGFPGDRFDLDTLWARLRESGATLVSLVPTMLYRLLEPRVELLAETVEADGIETHSRSASPHGWPDSLRLILLGGAAAPPELLARAFNNGLPVAVTYGLTEAASQVATAEPEMARRKPGSAGKPLPWTAVQVRGKDDCSLLAGEVGEIYVQGPTVMRGYLDQPPITDWLPTGDLGYLDADGDLWVVQRRNDLIVSGGENVYPAEVEGVIRQYPAVEDVCVVGLPHPEWGQQVAAALILRPGALLDEAELLAFCRSRLAGYKLPRRIVTLDEFPRTASGKIRRDALRAQLTDQQD